jgi:hypothetical protein
VADYSVVWIGQCGEDADAFVSLQRQVLVGILAGGVAVRDTLLALSLTNERFTGRKSMKSDSEEELMILAVL